MSRQLATNTAMKNVQKLIRTLQVQGRTPAEFLDELRDRGFEVRQARKDQDWEIKVNQSDWVKGSELAADGALYFTD